MTSNRRFARGKVPIRSPRSLVPDWEHVHPDHPIELALQRLKKNPGLLPVLSRSQVQRVEGVITQESLTEFLQSASERN